MNKIVLLAVLFIACLKINAQTTIIKANPLGLAFGFANLGVEFSGKTTNQSTTISVLHYSKSSRKGFGIGFEKRFYFSNDENLKGFHAGPSIGYLRLSDNYNDDFNVFSVGTEIGHQWFLNENFTVDIFSSVGFLISKELQLLLGLGLSLGYAW